ncbi:MAG: sigma-70 family RNA polymerase sigma factor [Candidatus Hydrogenedentes bacterium]|nr:sigma-70 family RNA polymerase sigma factor [Candidatus Hydrogenedentota bacterium]
MTMDDQRRADRVRAALDRYEAPLIRYATRLTGNGELARDIVQDTFVKLCTADWARIEAHLAPWLYRVCRNRALDVLKKENRMIPLAEGQAEARPDEKPVPGEVAEGHEAEALVHAALARLPEKNQEIFRLKFQHELTYKEISEVTGHDVNNIRYVIHTTLKTLRQQLQGRLDPALGQ